jgi:hypothetical protein
MCAHDHYLLRPGVAAAVEDFSMIRGVPQLWQLWQLPRFAGQSAQVCEAISKFHAHIFKISRSSLGND